MGAVGPYRGKRILDLVLVVLLAVPAAILLGTAAIALACSSRGPVLFRQERIGLDGQLFTLLKLRTMRHDPDRSIGFPDQLLVTPVGRVLRRTSLDELPQLWNVVKGDMSIVGPRPTVAKQVARYNERQRGRLAVRPGLTGLAQVRGRNALTWADRINLDLEGRLELLEGTVARILRGTGRVLPRADDAGQRARVTHREARRASGPHAARAAGLCRALSRQDRRRGRRRQPVPLQGRVRPLAPPRPRCGRATRVITTSTAVATGRSTRRCIASRSPSGTASAPKPAPTSSDAWPIATPRPRRSGSCGSVTKCSVASSPTNPFNSPPTRQRELPLDIGASRKRPHYAAERRASGLVNLLEALWSPPPSPSALQVEVADPPATGHGWGAQSARRVRRRVRERPPNGRSAHAIRSYVRAQPPT